MSYYLNELDRKAFEKREEDFKLTTLINNTELYQRVYESQPEENTEFTGDAQMDIHGDLVMNDVDEIEAFLHTLPEQRVMTADDDEDPWAELEEPTEEGWL